jgi:hypothetical protein
MPVPPSSDEHASSRRSPDRNWFALSLLSAVLAIIVAVSTTTHGPAAPVNRKDALSASTLPRQEPARGATADTAVKSAVPLPDDARSLISDTCVDCHGGADSPMGVDLAALLSDAAPDRNLTIRVFEAVARETMPPRDSSLLAADSRRALVESLRKHLIATENDAVAALHRLNRREYLQTVADLLGPDCTDGVQLPADGGAHGFDNNVDGLFFTPAAYEQYLQAAFEISERAVGLGGPPSVESREYSGQELAGRLARFGIKVDDGAYALTNLGSLACPIEVEHAGTYTIRIRVIGFADPKDPKLPKLGVRLDAEPPHVLEVEGAREFVVQEVLSRGLHSIAIGLHDGPRGRRDGEPAKYPRRIHLERVSVEGPTEVPWPPPGNASVLGEDYVAWQQSGQGDTSVLPPRRTPEEFWSSAIDRFAARAFRRPLADRERDALLAAVLEHQTSGSSPEETARQLVALVLASPSFLFKGDARVVDLDLTADGLAARLSYAFWGTLPDEVLVQAASERCLSQPDRVAAEVNRLLSDPRSTAFYDGFFAHWLQYSRLEHVGVEVRNGESLASDVLADFTTETRLLCEYLVDTNAPVRDLVAADYGFLNQRLAKHYGVAGVEGEHFRFVRYEGHRPGGLLGHGAMLALTSHPRETSPVRRGKWVLETLLGSPPPPPPPNVPGPPDPEPGAAPVTIKARMELHRQHEACHGCHARMDGIGLCLEGLDQTGRLRTCYSDIEIDLLGEFSDGTELFGDAELSAWLGQHEVDLARAFSERLMIYLLGRPLKFSERMEAWRIAESVGPDYRVRDLIVAVVGSETVQQH